MSQIELRSNEFINGEDLNTFLGESGFEESTQFENCKNGNLLY